jgi:hypothetical protein
MTTYPAGVGQHATAKVETSPAVGYEAVVTIKLTSPKVSNSFSRTAQSFSRTAQLAAQNRIESSNSLQMLWDWACTNVITMRTFGKASDETEDKFLDEQMKFMLQLLVRGMVAPEDPLRTQR